MATATLPSLPGPRESLGGTLLLSLMLHGLLFGFGLAYVTFGLRFGGGWGQNWGAGGTTRISAVASLPGVPLPAPMLTTRSTLATENPGLYRNEAQTEPKPAEPAEEIPKFQQAVKPERVVRLNKRIQKETLETPANAIPFGLGGKPSMAYSQFANTAGEGGVSFGEGNFRERYGWYVAGVGNRISNNWLVSIISQSILSAPRVYLTFDILRDGTITNVQTSQSSGAPEIDRSALRAVLASNPLAPLPPDYSGSKVSVEFYFDFHRR